MGAIEDLRNDFCARASALKDGSLQLKDALSGVHVHMITVLTASNKAWFDEPIGNSDPSKMSGFHVKVVERLAQEAGFTYTIHSVPESAFFPTLSIDEYLSKSLEKFDLNVQKWVDTSERAMLGMRVAFDFLDDSLVAVTHGQLHDQSFWHHLTNFSHPLDESLWCFFLLVSLATSLIYCLVERGGTTDAWEEGDADGAKCLSSVWLGFVSLTGGGGFTPKTRSGQIVTLTYTFFVLLLVSAYTANLAAALTVRAQLDACQTFAECTSGGSRACVPLHSAVESWFRKVHGALVSNDQMVLSRDVYADLLNGHCTVAVDLHTTYRLAKESVAYNPRCTMTRVGESDLVHYGGGWMGRDDYYGGCTSVLRDAFDVVFLKLSASGEFNKMMDEFVSSQATQVCNAGSSSSSASSFPIESMLGPLVIHGVGLALAGLLFSLQRFRLQGQRCQEQGPEARDAVGPDALGTQAEVAEMRRDVADMSRKVSEVMQRLGSHFDSQTLRAGALPGTATAEACNQLPAPTSP